MNKFKVISGTEKRSYKPTVYNYLNAMGNLISRQNEEEPKEFLKKFVFLATKLYLSENEKQLSYEELQEKLTAMFELTNIMAELTPIEFMQMFPIPKEYDGEKWCQKDYFSTISYVKKYPADCPITTENITEFLMEYYNWDIMRFEVEKLSVISEIRQLEGKMGVMEEFLFNNGVPTYSYYEKEGIMINQQTGEVTKVSKPKKRIPRYIKIVED